MTILLVVDDDPENIRALQNVLEAAGYEVVSAVDGVDAFEALRRVSPRAVLTDWQMQNMDGWTFCQKVRATPEYASVPVILLSANVVPVNGDSGWSAFFRKPVDFGRLLQCISLLCSTSRVICRVGLAISDPACSRWQAIDSRCWP